MPEYYDRQGQSMTMIEWANAFEQPRNVGKSDIGDQQVSTVWIGLDHQFGEGPPLIFETMIFGGPHDQYQERYSTEQEALRGHMRIIAALKEGKSPS